jgi:WD40 repeat protein
MKPLSDIDFIQAYLDGELTPEQVVALENRLRNEPRLADQLLRMAREEAITIEWAGAQAAYQEKNAGKDRVRLDRGLPRHPRPRRWVAALLVASVASAAAIVLAFLGSFPLLSPNPGPQPIAKGTEQGPTHAESPALAKLDDVLGEVYVVSETGETAAQPGQTLRQGQALRAGRDGYAVVTLADASRLEVGTDTLVRLTVTRPPTVTDQRSLITKVFIEEGTLGVDASQQPRDRPMVVATPHAEARLDGSRANFTSVPRGTRIEQERGQLQLTRKSDGQSIDMPTGSYVVASANSNEKLASQPMPQPITQARLILKEAAKDAFGAVHSLAYAPDGGTLAAGCGEGTVKFWNMAASGLAMPGFKTGGRQPVRGLAYSPNGAFLVATSEDRSVKFYSGATHQELGALKGAHKSQINCLAFSPTGALLATGSGGPQRGGELKLWNVDTRQELVTLLGQGPPVLAVVFSPDSRFLAAGFRDGVVRVWDLTTREVKQTLVGHTAQVNAIAFAPDGATLATAGKDLTIKFWDTATGAEQRTFAGLISEVRSIAFSPDGRLFAAADHSVRLWNLATGQQMRMLKGHKNTIAAVIFSPSGKEIATAGSDRTIRVWDVPTP